MRRAWTICCRCLLNQASQGTDATLSRRRGPFLPTRRASFDVAHFRFCREGGGQQIGPGNRSGGSRHRRGGHAANAWRSARVSGPRRLARPPGLPRSSQTPVSEEFVLAKLTPKRRRPIGQAFGRGQETRAQRGYLGGVRRPAPSAGAFQGGVQLARRVIGLGISVERVRDHPQYASGARAAGLGMPAPPSGRFRTSPRFQRNILVNILCRHLTKCSVLFLRKIV